MELELDPELDPERCRVRPLEALDAAGDRIERLRERERLPARARQDGEVPAEEVPAEEVPPAHRKRCVMHCTCIFRCRPW